MKVLRYPIIAIVFFFVSGILYDFYRKPDTNNLLLFCSVSGFVFCLSYYFSQKDFLQKNYFGLTLCLFSFAAGSFVHHVHYEPNHPRHYTCYLKEDYNEIRGTLSERLKPNAFAEKYYFTITEINRHPVFGTLLLNIPKTTAIEQPAIGDVLLLNGPVTLIPRAINPYHFDYAAYMEKQNVFHQLHLDSGNFVKTGQKRNFDFYTARYRDKLLSGFSIHHFRPEVQHVIDALLLGQRQDMEKETSSSYTDAGVVHILAISGLHIAVLYGMLLFIIKPLKKHKKGNILQLVSVLAFLWIFAILSGLSASVVRSVTMFSIISFGLFLNRTANIYNSLAVSVLLLLLFKPDFLFDVGFQLSYIAVFAIVWLQPFYRKIKFGKNRILHYFTDTALISLAAQIGVMPLCLYYFNQVPSLFLLANLVVIPLSTVILILGIFVLVLNFVSAAVAVFFGRLLSFLIEVMNDYIAWVASFKDFVIKDIPFTFLLMISLYLSLIFFLLWLRKKSFPRFAGWLVTVMILQLVYMATLTNIRQKDELVIFNNRKHPLITVKQKAGVRAFSNDSLIEDNYNLKMYRKGLFNPEVRCFPLQQLLFYGNRKILIIDHSGLYAVGRKPDVIILTGSPKINLERVMAALQPELVIADGTNYKSDVKRWEKSCEKTKIPFYATSKKGFYKIANTN